MKNRILLAALLAGALVTVSCNKDRTLYYNSLEMGVLQADGRIITDGGLTYSVTENGTEYTLSGKEGRIIFLADVLQETSDLHYDIRLKNIATVPTPDLIKEQDLPSSADNAVRVNSAWFGGGFLNLSLSYLVEPSSTVEHQIRFAEQTVENGKDTLFIRIYPTVKYFHSFFIAHFGIFAHCVSGQILCKSPVIIVNESYIVFK